MVRTIAVAALLFLIAPWIQAAGFDFTPLESFYEVEGVRMPRMQFHHDGKPIAYTPPSGWKPSGRGKVLSLIPPQVIQAGATFEAEPLGRGPFAASTENLRAFRERATALLPAEATKVEVISAAVSTLRVSGRGVVEVFLDYSLAAQPFKMCVFFIPHDEEMVRLSVAAHARDFEPLEKAFRRSLYSLQGF